MSLSGEWVGKAVVTTTEDGKDARPAVLYLHLATLDGFLGKVHGPAQLCLQGENRVRALKVVELWPPNSANGETRVSGTISGDLLPGNAKDTVEGAGRDVKGSFDGGTLILTTEPDGFSPGLIFHATLQPRTHDEYATLCRQL